MEQQGYINTDALSNFNKDRDLIIVLDDIRTSGATTSGMLKYITGRFNLPINSGYSITISNNRHKSILKDLLLDNILNRFKTMMRRR